MPRSLGIASAPLDRIIASVGVGALNHENILILVTVVALWNQIPRRTMIAFGCAALIAHLVARIALQKLVPLQSLLELHVWTNAVLLEQMRRTMVEGLIVLVFTFGCAAVTFRDGDTFLKRASIVLFLQLLLIAFVAGRFNEARNFEAFIPVLIALVLSTARRQGLSTIQ